MRGRDRFLRQQSFLAFALHNGGERFIRQNRIQTAADRLDRAVEVLQCYVCRQPWCRGTGLVQRLDDSAGQIVIPVSHG